MLCASSEAFDRDGGVGYWLVNSAFLRSLPSYGHECFGLLKIFSNHSTGKRLSHLLNPLQIRAPIPASLTRRANLGQFWRIHEQNVSSRDVYRSSPADDNHHRFAPCFAGERVILHCNREARCVRLEE